MIAGMDNEEVILRDIVLDPERHRPTGKTRHIVGGELWEGARGLRIVRYAADGGFYLLYLDESGREVTDTWHESLEDALRQATFEFNVDPEDWTLAA